MSRSAGERIYGHLSKMRHASIRIRTAVPGLSALPTVDCPWERAAHAGATGLTPEDIPRPLGRPVRMVSCVDSDLCHNVSNGGAVTATLHSLSQTPSDWCPKRQATVETATCGAEYSAARTCIEQIRAHRLTLMCLGVPTLGSSHMSGDNKSVIDSSTGLRPRLHKRWSSVRGILFSHPRTLLMSVRGLWNSSMRSLSRACDAASTGLPLWGTHNGPYVHSPVSHSTRRLCGDPRHSFLF